MNPDDLLARFGTPAYVYDRADVRDACADLRNVLPGGSTLYYSVKANPHPDICAQLARLGCRAEVSSTGEARAALAAGFDPGTTLMNGPGKSADAIHTAVALGIRRFSVDSPVDLERVGAVAARHGHEVTCLLRVNADEPVPGMGLSMTGTASQFGADASWVLAEPELFRGSGAARVTGLHLYMGTHIDDADVLLHQFATSLRLAGRLTAALGVPVRELDLGGGFGIPYARAGDRPRFVGLREALTAILDEEIAGWTDGVPEVSFESGRYLVGGCGRLYCQVLDVKVSKGRVHVVLDTGINHLGGMSGLRRVPRIVPDLLPLVDRAGKLDDCAVVGTLCTPLDAWCQGVTLPRLVPGDVLTVPNVGAYGLTAGMLAFLSHPAAVEIVVDNDDLVSASRLQLHRVPVPERIPSAV